MSKHTPGPWRAIAGDIQAQSLDEEWDLTIATGIDEENLPLLTAAPELLEALKDSVALLQEVVRNTAEASLVRGTIGYHLKKIESAIRKAEGK